MESPVKIGDPINFLIDKHKYERFLLESLNLVSSFVEKSGGGFSTPQCESHGECDAIGKNGYDIDFKLLINSQGAKNLSETRRTKKEICPGVTIDQPSKASMRGCTCLEFPMIWRIFVEHYLYLTESKQISIKDEFISGKCNFVKHTKASMHDINKMIRKKKNLLLFLPHRFFTKSSHDSSVEIFRCRAEEGLTIISSARKNIVPCYDTYYAFLLNEEIVFLSQTFTLLGCIELRAISSWYTLRRE